MTNKFYIPKSENLMTPNDLLKKTTENTTELIKIGNSIDNSVSYISDYTFQFNALIILLVIIIVELAFIGYKFHKNK